MAWDLVTRLRRALSPEPEPAFPSKIGLALGGGAVRGAAHLGVLSVLEREGVRPAVVAGTSVGAIVGAGVAAGIPVDEMLNTFGKATWLRLATPAWWSRLSLLDTSPLGALIEQVTHAKTFEELAMPLATVSCDVLTGHRVVSTSGSLREAVVASAAIPGLFEPVRRGDMLMVDGGVIDNLPVDAARGLGADYVIAVDIMPPLDGTFVPRDMRDVILLSWNIVQHEGERGRGRADLVITPDVSRVPPSDFSGVQEAFDAGVAAAEAVLPRLRADLGLVPR